MAKVGETIGGFSLVRQLGAGTRGETWEAVRRVGREFEQRVAIKLPSAAALQGLDGRERLRRGAFVAASLRHPNIAAVIDLDEEQGFIVCELVEGAALSAVRQEAPSQRLPWPMLVHVMCQVGRGLSHAHRRLLRGQASPVVHCDLSPANLVVDCDGHVKIVDFGIETAPAVADRAKLEHGKRAYMAPEQVAGAVPHPGFDQYSLGVIAYEAVSGQRPTEGGNDREVLENLLAGRHVPIGRRVPELPTGVADVIERMLQLDPSQRFPSVDAMIEALEPFTPPLGTQRALAALVQRAHPPETGRQTDGGLVHGDGRVAPTSDPAVTSQSVKAPTTRARRATIEGGYTVPPSLADRPIGSGTILEGTRPSAPSAAPRASAPGIAPDTLLGGGTIIEGGRASSSGGGRAQPAASPIPPNRPPSAFATIISHAPPHPNTPLGGPVPAMTPAPAPNTPPLASALASGSTVPTPQRSLTPAAAVTPAQRSIGERSDESALARAHEAERAPNRSFAGGAAEQRSTRPGGTEAQGARVERRDVAAAGLATQAAPRVQQDDDPRRASEPGAQGGPDMRTQAGDAWVSFDSLRPPTFETGVNPTQVAAPPRKATRVVTAVLFAGLIGVVGWASWGSIMGAGATRPQLASSRPVAAVEAPPAPTITTAPALAPELAAMEAIEPTPEPEEAPPRGRQAKKATPARNADKPASQRTKSQRAAKSRAADTEAAPGGDAAGEPFDQAKAGEGRVAADTPVDAKDPLSAEGPPPRRARASERAKPPVRTEPPVRTDAPEPTDAPVRTPPMRTEMPVRAEPPVRAEAPVRSAPVRMEGAGDELQPASEEASSASGRAQPSSREGKSAAGRGLVKVSIQVVPGGRVWIDGVMRGTASPGLSARLRPGQHTIAVGDDKPVQTRTVEIKAGQPQTISFEVEP